MTAAGQSQGGATVVDGAYVVTMDTSRTEHASGHVVVEGNHVVAVGAGPAPTDARRRADRVIDGSGCVLTPGLVNTHHHLYQWATRGMATDESLFGWLTTLYPVWAGLDEEAVGVTARAALARLAASGCTTSTDHHYVFPRGGGDLFAAEVEAARDVGMRFHPCRGSMDLGRSDGGLPPDSVVEDRDAVLSATADAVDRWHDPAPGSMCRVAVGPCSPFSATGDLMRESAGLARSRGVLLHTHLAETVDEDAYCRERFGCLPLEYAESLGWLGPDVWFAHAVHLDDAAVERVGATGTGVAHCPSSNARLGAGIAPARALRDAGARVGLGVDGAASNEASNLLGETRNALLFARACGGPASLGVRDALEMATLGGAAVLGRADELGSVEPGKLADVALWRLDTLAHADMADPVAALVLGAPAPLELVLVDGRPVVERGRVVTTDEHALAARARSVSLGLLAKARERA